MKKQMPIESYHLDPAISKSRLDLINRSLRHFTNPVNYERAYFNFGSAVHDCILLPDIFKKSYVCVPNEFDARKKEYKDLKEVYDNDKIVIIKKKQYDAILDIRERIMSQSITKNIIERSESEMSYFTDTLVGGEKMAVKCRPDALDGINMIDLKTTQDTSKDSFMWAIKRYRYHVQSAFYSDVYEKESGNKIENFLFIAIENSEPYSIRTYILNRESEDIGRREYKKNLLQIKKYRDNPNQTFIESLAIETIGLPASSFYEDTL